MSKVILDTHVLDALTRRLDTDVDGVLRSTAIRVEGRAKIHAPLDTGALRNSINTTKRRNLLYWVSDGVEYGIYQEFGTFKMAAQPFMIPAVEETSDELIQMLGRAIEK